VIVGLAPGIDVVIFKKYFRRKIWLKYWRFLLKLLQFFVKKCDHNIVFLKNADFFAEIWLKSPKIVITYSIDPYIVDEFFSDDFLDAKAFMAHL
jgi:hypothetical protein